MATRALGVAWQQSLASLVQTAYDVGMIAVFVLLIDDWLSADGFANDVAALAAIAFVCAGIEMPIDDAHRRGGLTLPLLVAALCMLWTVVTMRFIRALLVRLDLVNPSTTDQAVWCAVSEYWLRQAHVKLAKMASPDPPAIPPSAQCIRCRVNRRHGDHAFCGIHCAHAFRPDAPVVVPLCADSGRFRRIQQEFDDNWRHEASATKPRGALVEVFEIFMAHTLSAQHSARIAATAANRRHLVRMRGSTEGNTIRAYHGTRLKCTFAVDASSGTVKLCATPDCRVCSIVKRGFLLTKVNTMTSFSRYGAGLYFSCTSSKAHDYTGSPAPDQNALGIYDIPQRPAHRSMFVVSVAAGQVKRALEHTEPRPDAAEFDSIVADAGQTSGINHHEIAVYEESRALPRFLLIYRMGPAS